MPRPARTSLVVAAGLVGALLGASPTHAAPGDVTPVNQTAASAYPVDLMPLSHTAAATVYVVAGDYRNIWIKPTGGAAVHETRIEDPEVVGDLIQESYLMDHGGAITWRTTTDDTLQEHEIPAGLYAETPTERGYIGRDQDSGDLVHVDLLDGGEASPVGTGAASAEQFTAGPAGVLTYGYSEGELRYYPYATPGAGRRLATQPAALRDCPVVTTSNAYCTLGEGLARFPLAGGAPTIVQTGGDHYDMAVFAGGVAVSAYDTDNQMVLKTWTGTTAAPVERLGATFRFGGDVASTPGGTSVVVSRQGALGAAGLWSVPVPTGSSSQLLAAPASDRFAKSIAIGPGAVAWLDNARVDDSVWMRDLSASGEPSGNERLVAAVPSYTSLAVAGGRVAHNPPVADPPNIGVLGVWQDGTTTPVEGAPSIWMNSFSGDRLLLQRHFAGDAQDMVLHDVRTGQDTVLEDGNVSDLWGERRVRLEDAGRVVVDDLRTGESVEVRAPTDAADYVFGDVHIAGDTVAWQLWIQADSELGGWETKVRNLATMAPATAIGDPDFPPSIDDLSTGYAIGSTCMGMDCGLWAMPVDGSNPVLVHESDGPGSDLPPAAIDGNTAAFIAGDHSYTAAPMVTTLPAYADAPRLLVHPELSSSAGPGRTWALRVVTSRILNACSVEIRNASNAVVRDLDCVDPYAAAEVAWDATDADGDAVAPGEYTWQITGATGAEDLVDYDGGDAALSGSVTVSDNPAPAVTARTPAVNGHSQSTAVNVTATFSEAVTGISGTTFELRTADDDVKVPAAVTYDAATRTATLNPSAGLMTDTLYEATLTGGASAIRDGADGALESTSWTFSTGPAPVATKFAPASNATAATLSGNVTATLNEVVQGVGTDSFSVRTAGGTPVPGAVSYSASTRTATFNPSANLLPDTKYTATLTGGADAVRDAVGNPFATRSWTFTTGPAPTVTGYTPAANATNVGRTANVVAAFSEPVTGVTTTTVKLKTSTGSTVSAAVSYSTTSRKVTINPTKALAAKTKYTVTLTGGTTAIRDAAGNPLTTKTWSFTTGS